MNQKANNQNKKNDVATYTVSGVLEEEGSKTKLMYANVGVLNVKDSAFVRGASTDENGKFTITNVPTGEYFLRVSSIGYQSTYMLIKVLQGNINLGVVKVGKGATSLDAVVIKEIVAVDVPLKWYDLPSKKRVKNKPNKMLLGHHQSWIRFMLFEKRKNVRRNRR